MLTCSRRLHVLGSPPVGCCETLRHCDEARESYSSIAKEMSAPEGDAGIVTALPGESRDCENHEITAKIHK